MAALCIVSDRPGAGKTSLAAALALKLMREGKRVAYVKAGAEEGDPDVAFFQRDVLKDGRAASAASLGDAQRAAQAAGANAGMVLVEGSSLGEGGAPELVSALGCQAVIVQRYVRGLSADGVVASAAPLGRALAGVLLNAVTRYRLEEARAGLARRIEAGGARVLGVVPEDRTLVALTVGDLARAIDARWVSGEARAGNLVEHVLVGGFFVQWGPDYLGRYVNKAVVTRGNKPDVQFAALRTPGTSCLVLTSGTDSVQYVYKEAELQDVPVLQTQADTLAVMAAIEKAQLAASALHPRKAERFSELLAQHADLTPLLQTA